MNENDYKIVRITNIAPFDFTGDLGARYGGRDFFVPAGGSLLVPLTVGQHLAKHLARQMIIQKAPVRDGKEVDGKGSDRPLWDEAKINSLVKQIMVEAYEEEAQVPQTEGERMQEKVAELNKVTKEPDEVGGNVDASGVVPVEDANSAIIYKDKAEVIAELNERKIPFDARLGKNKLEELLVETPVQETPTEATAPASTA
jgi:hypothetical protein